MCNFDKELLQNKEIRRPYVVIVRLKYGDGKFDFAVPFRSNIPPGADPTQFSLYPLVALQNQDIFMDYTSQKCFQLVKCT